MSSAEGFEFEGLHCFQSPDDPALFYFVPGDPGPEVDAQNRPTLLMLVSSSSAILQLGAHWNANASQLAALRNELARRYPEIDAGAIRLSASAATVSKVAVNLGDGNGHFEELQSSASSGFPPFAAIFNIRLTAEQKDRALAALKGRSGFLTITYSVSFTSDVSVTVVISGDVRTDLDALSGDATIEECRDRITAGLTDGHLTQTVSEDALAPAELKSKALSLAVEKAAVLLQSQAHQQPPQASSSTLRVTATLSGSASRSEKRLTDVSSWFPNGEGTSHVRPIGGGTDGPPPAPVQGDGLTASFDFDDRTDLPIAFVAVACGSAAAVLRPPGFDPVVLAGVTADGSLTVTTHYTAGGPTFQVTTGQPEAGGWRLGLSQLGLQRVVVDGTARQKAGAREVRVRVQYRPSGNGISEDRTIYLRHDSWVQLFYVVTRDAGINGMLQFDWNETGGDGSVKTGRIETADPKLQFA